MRKPLLMAFAILISSSLAEAAAQNATPADRATIEKCAKEKVAAGEDRSKCVGIIADACLDKSEDPSTYGMATCSRREEEVWDERLNAAYKKLMADVERKQRNSVRDMQRSWIAFRDKKCGLHRVLEEGSIVIPTLPIATWKRPAGRRYFWSNSLTRATAVKGAARVPL
jgi:uncharacterized protein YecT (DUF1311 family)